MKLLPVMNSLIRFRLLLLFLLLLQMCPGQATAADPDQKFRQTIQPLLDQYCGKCHSAAVQRGQLNLSSPEGLLAGGESGARLLNSAAGRGILAEYIESGEMPPAEAPPLPDSDRGTLLQWLSEATHESMQIDTVPATPTDHNVYPILLLRCKTCHGPQRKDGGVDLSSPQALLIPGPGGPNVIPGQPEASLIISRIESEACPPRESLLKFFVRRPVESEVQTLKDWIAAGCPQSDDSADIATNSPDPLVTADDREHWAFRKLNGDPQSGSIDEFISAKLEQSGLKPAPVADRAVLIRRATLDLTGLPPDPRQLQFWLQNPSAEWYTELIDSLLASPHYGERWGRYWLDLAGYADSEGGVSADPIRPAAWKYRDYVINSFNTDKPYDRFLTEQLAGDELIDFDNASEVSEEMVSNLTATGFLRMGIDQTGSRTMNFVPERLGVINDVLTVVGSGLMGLTVECARCHSHKYDAIPQRDYYRLKAVFQGALDEHDWLTFRNRTLRLATPTQLQLMRQINPPLQKKIQALQQELQQLERTLRLTMLQEHYPQQSPEDRELTLAALKIADNTRTLPQRQMVELLQKAESIPEEQQPPAVQQVQLRIEHQQDSIHRLQRQLVPDDTIRALWDQGRPSPTYLLRRGEHQIPGELVGPGVPSVLTDGRTPFVAEPPFPSGTPRTGRRLAFARWLTSPEHPLTARVFVNRVWQHHFAAGLVRSTENFGVQGELPSHPELLDWLALRFMQDGWSIKQLHRLIMTSHTYRQQSKVTAEMLQQDPENRLLSIMPLRRMDAETLRDSLLATAGRLHLRQGGPPDPVRVRSNGQVSVLPQDDGNWRRSIYALYRRTEIPTMIATFDYPVMGPNCLSRTVSSVAQQPLLLSNSAHVHELAASFAARVAESAGKSVPDQVRSVSLIALGREPTAEELEIGCNALQTLTELSGNDPQAALQAWCHTVHNSAAFLYID